MTDEILIQTEHLYRYYSGHCAVADLGFELRRGEILGFLGPNGAGKTTTMQMLTGNLAPTSGRIRIHGMDLLERPLAAKRQIGYLPEQPPLYRELTVREYLDHCARLHRIPRRQIAAAVDRATERCGLGEVRNRLIGNLSKGFQQRVGIAQAIIHVPAVVILDEPTVGLDPLQIRHIRELIRDLGREHAVILSSHILPEIQETCTRVQIIHRGRLVFNEAMDRIDERLRIRALLLQTSAPAEAERLAAVPGVSGVQALSERRWRIDYDGDSPAPALAETVVAAGWGLESLEPVRRTLEQVFVELTAGDPQVVAPASEEAA